MRRLVCAALVAAALGAACSKREVSEGRAEPGRASGDANSPSAPGGPPRRIAALVNGEPLYLDEVEAGLDQKLAGPERSRARAGRLSALVEAALSRQFLDSQGIEVPPEKIEEELREMRLEPPYADCGCCRHTSLEAYLAANFMTLAELRAKLRRDLGLDLYADRAFLEAYPTEESRRGLVAKELARLVKDHGKSPEEPPSYEEALRFLRDEFQRRIWITTLRRIASEAKVEKRPID